MRSRAAGDHTLYSWWSLVSTGVCLLLLVVALSYFAAPTIGPVELSFGLVLGAPAAWTTLRAPWMRVVLRPDALVHHGLLRTWTIPRTAISRVEGADTGNIGGSAEAPQLVLANGKEHHLRCLASHSPRRSAAWTTAIATWLADEAP